MGSFFSLIRPFSRSTVWTSGCPDLRPPGRWSVLVLLPSGCVWGGRAPSPQGVNRWTKKRTNERRYEQTSVRMNDRTNKRQYERRLCGEAERAANDLYMCAIHMYNHIYLYIYSSGGGGSFSPTGASFRSFLDSGSISHRGSPRHPRGTQ